MAKITKKLGINLDEPIMSDPKLFEDILKNDFLLHEIPALDG